MEPKEIKTAEEEETIETQIDDAMDAIHHNHRG